MQLSVAIAIPVAAAEVSAPQFKVIFTGQVMTGGVLSSTVMVCIQLAELSHPSVATQVLVIVIHGATPVVTSE